MKAHDKEVFFSILTLDGIGVTQGQGQKCRVFTLMIILTTI